MLDCAISYFLESVSHRLNLILFPAYLLSYTLTETHKPVLKKNQPFFDWKGSCLKMIYFLKGIVHSKWKFAVQPQIDGDSGEIT